MRNIDVKLVDDEDEGPLLHRFLSQRYRRKFYNFSSGFNYGNEQNYIIEQDVDIIQLLIDSNIDINIQDINQQIALHVSIINSHYDVAYAILQQQDVNVNVQDRDGDITLHVLFIQQCYDDSSDVINLLLDMENININIRNSQGKTPLHILIDNFGRYEPCYDSDDDSNDNSDMAFIDKLLLRPDIDVGIKDNNGNKVLHLAVGYVNNIVVEKLLQRCDIGVNDKNNSNLTPFKYFVHKFKQKEHLCSDPPVMLTYSHLLDGYDVDVNSFRDKDGKTLLHIACDGYMNGLIAKISQRLDINVNAVNKYGWTPLMCSIPFAPVDSIHDLEQYLLNPRTNVNTINNQGRTALDIACSEHNGYEEIDLSVIKRLLAVKAVTYYDLSNTNLAKLENTRVDEPNMTQNCVFIEDYNYVLEYRSNTNILLKMQLGLDPVSKVFAMIVLLCDDYYRLKQSSRFYNICCKLPMNLQMVMCHRLFDSMRNNVTSKLFTARAKRLLNQ